MIWVFWRGGGLPYRSHELFHSRKQWHWVVWLKKKRKNLSRKFGLYSPIGNIKASETANVQGRIRNAGCIPDVRAYDEDLFSTRKSKRLTYDGIENWKKYTCGT